jgi:hypothetical protein
MGECAIVGIVGKGGWGYTNVASCHISMLSYYLPFVCYLFQDMIFTRYTGLLKDHSTCGDLLTIIRE